MFLKRNLAYLYPHRFSQITHLSFVYLTEAVLICKNSQAYLPCIYCLVKTIRGEECHTLIPKTLEIKNLSTLTGILLIRGIMGYHFIIFPFFKVDTEVPLILLPDTCPFFCEVVEHLLLFISSNYSYFCIVHASKAIILRKSESFWINVLILGAW